MDAQELIQAGERFKRSATTLATTKDRAVEAEALHEAMVSAV